MRLTWGDEQPTRSCTQHSVSQHSQSDSKLCSPLRGTEDWGLSGNTIMQRVCSCHENANFKPKIRWVYSRVWIKDRKRNFDEEWRMWRSRYNSKIYVYPKKQINIIFFVHEIRQIVGETGAKWATRGKMSPLENCVNNIGWGKSNFSFFPYFFQCISRDMRL